MPLKAAVGILSAVVSDDNEAVTFAFTITTLHHADAMALMNAHVGGGSKSVTLALTEETVMWTVATMEEATGE